MPMIKVSTSVDASGEKLRKLASDLSARCAAATGKPERYVAVFVESGAVASFGGESADAAFVEARGIGGMTPDVVGKLSADICSAIEAELGVPSDRTYINFMDVPASMWGWNGATFG